MGKLRNITAPMQPPPLRYVCEEAVPDACMCAICLAPLLEPRAAPCGHAFCRPCIGLVLASAPAPSCPKCRGPLGPGPLADPPDQLLDLLDDLLIYCRRADDGCGWMGRRADIVAHLAQECPESAASCANRDAGCDATVLRKLLGAHLAKDCAVEAEKRRIAQQRQIQAMEVAKLRREKLQQLLTRQEDWITINAAGTVIQTSRQTLCRFPDSLLSELFSGELNTEPGAPIFLDCHGPGFSLLVECLQLGRRPSHLEASEVELVRDMAQLWGIPSQQIAGIADDEKERWTQKELSKLINQCSCFDADEGCVLTSLNLPAVKLNDLRMESLCFRHLNLKGASLRGTSMVECTQAFGETLNLAGCDLRGSNFARSSLRVNFAGSLLEGANFADATLEIEGIPDNFDSVNFVGARVIFLVPIPRETSFIAAKFSDGVYGLDFRRELSAKALAFSSKWTTMFKFSQEAVFKCRFDPFYAFRGSHGLHKSVFSEFRIECEPDLVCTFMCQYSACYACKSKSDTSKQSHAVWEDYLTSLPVSKFLD